MNQSLLLAGSLVLGVAGGLLGSKLTSTPPPTTARADGSPAGSTVDRADLERLERRVDELSAAVGARATVAPEPVALAVAPPSIPSGESLASPSAPPDSRERVDALEKRVAELERGGARGTPVPADLSKVPIPQLEALVRNLTGEKRNAEAVKVAEELLRRNDLTADQRVDTEMNIGYALRGQGKFAEAEARFRETLARVGENTEKAPWLGFQIAWERSYQQDLPGAIAEMEKAASHPQVQPIVRAHALYNAAAFSRQTGETARARVFLERLLHQYADAIPPSQAAMKAQAEAWLKELGGN